MILLNAIEGVLSLLLMGLVGYVLAGKGWFNKETSALLPKLVTKVSLPLFLLCNLITTFHRDDLVHMIYGVIVPMLSMMICFVLSLVLGKLCKVNKRHIGIFYSTFVASNSIFVGLPVDIALFGEESLPYTLLYFFANTTFFWTFGNYYISSDGDSRKVDLFSMETVKKVFSAPIIGFLSAIVIIMLEISVPDFLVKTARYLGGMTTPLAIIFIGIVLYGIDLKKIRLDKDILLVLLGRFVISPLSIVLVTYFIPIPDLMRKVFIIQASLPVMAQTVILASFYKADSEYATILVSLSTLLSMLTIPLYMVLIS